MFSQTLYQNNLKTLELDDNCTLAEIKEHYRHLVKLCHPDQYFNDKDLFQVAQNTLKKCNIAYEYLIQYYQIYVPPKAKKTSHSSSKKHHYENDIEYETDIELEKKYKTENEDNTKYYVILNFSKQFTIVIYLYIATVIIFLFKI